jgi:hypothetical protein
MIVTETLDLFVISLMFISVLVAVVIGAHSVVILRSILRADQRGGHAGHYDGREYEQSWLPKVLHGAILNDGGCAHAMHPPTRRQFPSSATSCRCQPTLLRQKYPSNRVMA